MFLVIDIVVAEDMLGSLQGRSAGVSGVEGAAGGGDVVDMSRSEEGVVPQPPRTGIHVK